LGAFLVGVAFLPAFPFFGATWPRRAPTRAFLVALGSSAAEAGAVPVSGVDVMIFSPLAVITVMTSITPVRPQSKANLHQGSGGDGTAIISCSRAYCDDQPQSRSPAKST
jgi:hypothetical protein